MKKIIKIFKQNIGGVYFSKFLSVLAIIQNKYPGFRHNDLKANNLLVQKIPISKTINKFKYKINGQIYIIPSIGFQIKLWDFLTLLAYQD